MTQLSLYELLILFHSCILYYLITTICMFVLTMSGMQWGYGGGRGRTWGKVITTKVAKQKKSSKDGKTTQKSLRMLFLIPTASKTCNSPNTFLKMLRSLRLTCASSSHKDLLTLRRNEHLWVISLAPWDHSEGASSHGSTSNKGLIRPDGKE